MNFFSESKFYYHRMSILEIEVRLKYLTLKNRLILNKITLNEGQLYLHHYKNCSKILYNIYYKYYTFNILEPLNRKDYNR